MKGEPKAVDKIGLQFVRREYPEQYPLWSLHVEASLAGGSTLASISACDIFVIRPIPIPDRKHPRGQVEIPSNAFFPCSIEDCLPTQASPWLVLWYLVVEHHIWFLKRDVLMKL